MKKLVVLGGLLAVACLLATNACNWNDWSANPPAKQGNEGEDVGPVYSRLLRFPKAGSAVGGGGFSIAEGEFFFKKRAMPAYFPGEDTARVVSRWYMKAPPGYISADSTDWLVLSYAIWLRLTNDAVQATADSLLEASGFDVEYRSPQGAYAHPIYEVIVDPDAAPYLGGDIPLLFFIDSFRAHSDIFDVVVPLFFSQVFAEPS
jgi:hypothetical protein